ncbi:MAG: DNA alkylation repair protein [bacterium]|nr:DNA alkylation repair protein [bacterium]
MTERRAQRAAKAMPDRASDIESVSAGIGWTIEAQADRTAPALHALRRDLSKQLEDSSGRDVVQIALNLAKRDEYIFRFAACAVIFHHRDALERLTLKAAEQLGRGIDSWGDVDVFAGYVCGPAWRVGRLKDSHIHRWARSRDRWWRRTALVSTVALNRKSIGGTGDVRRTLDVCRMLVGDADDMVVKALSWALRELIRHDANAVRRFLVTHDGALARRVVREVNNKLDTGVKNPRL